MTERKKMIERVKALLSKTVDHGCSEEEAAAALAKAKEMMDKYDIDHADIHFGGEQCETEGYDWINRNVAPRYMASAIARFCNCKVWNVMTGQRTRRIDFFGLESDVIMAKWLLGALDAFVDRQTKAFIHKHSHKSAHEKRQLRNGFVLGCCNRINERLDALAEQSYTNAPFDGGQSLVVVKNAMVEEAFANLSVVLRAGRKGWRGCDGGAHSAGRAAGEVANFNKPVAAQQRMIGVR